MATKDDGGLEKASPRGSTAAEARMAAERQKALIAAARAKGGAE